MCTDFFAQVDDNGNVMLQSFLSILYYYSKKKSAEDALVSRTATMGKTGKKSFFKDYMFTLLYAAELKLSRLKLSTR